MRAVSTRMSKHRAFSGLVPADTPLTAADVMSVGEVADLLHVPRSTVSDGVRRGIVPSVKIGRRWLYVRRQVEALLLGVQS